MIYILGMGSAHPKTVITNKFLEDLDIGTTCEWIEQKIGIIERVTTLPIDYILKTKNADPRAAVDVAYMSSIDLAVEAGEKAIKNSGLAPSQIGLVITNTCAPTQTLPTQSHQIAVRLGISSKTYDVVTACPAFALHMHYLNSFEPQKLPEYILCISTATMTQSVNYNDRTDGAIWGDGAAAWIVSTKEKGKLKVLDTFFDSDCTRAGAVVVDRYGFFHQDGRAVRDFSVRQTVRLIKKVESNYSINWSKDIFIGHQANRTMLEQITNNRAIPDQNHWHNVTYLGNIAGARSPKCACRKMGRYSNRYDICDCSCGSGVELGVHSHGIPLVCVVRVRFGKIRRDFLVLNPRDTLSIPCGLKLVYTWKKMWEIFF